MPSAKYVEFTTLLDPAPDAGPALATCSAGRTRRGCALDEAMHPLALLATGMYGKTIPNQNGAPLRLVVPWKYGFKGIKSIVRIRFTDTQPNTAWNDAASREYGFYANVNPTVDHPRWTQAKERRIGEFLKRNTLMFNGYATEVALALRGHGPPQVLLSVARGTLWHDSLATPLRRVCACWCGRRCSARCRGWCGWHSPAGSGPTRSSRCSTAPGTTPCGCWPRRWRSRRSASSPAGGGS